MPDKYDYLLVKFPVQLRIAIPKDQDLTEETLEKALRNYLNMMAESNDGSEFLANLRVRGADIEPMESRYD